MKTITISSPDTTFINLWKKLSPAVKSAFFTACIVGFLVHGYALCHNFLNLDSMWNIYSDQNMISSGRQFLGLACQISSYYSLPWLNGILSILYLAITAAFVTDSFNLKTRWGGALTAAILVAFPTVASTFCYMFTADGYMLSLMLTVIAFWLCDKKKWGFVPSIFLLGFSIGIYQAYLSFIIILCILVLLLSVLEEPWSKIVGKVWRYAVMGIGGYAFYVISLKIMLHFENATMSGYQGTDKVGSFSLSGLPAGLYSAIRNTASFALRSNVLTENLGMKLVFYGCILAVAVCFVLLFVHYKTYKSIARILFMLFLIVMLPFGLSTIAIMSSDVFFHLLLRMPWALLFVFLVVLVEKDRKEIPKQGIKIIGTCATALVGIMVFEFAVWSNVAYFNMNERYEKTYALSIRLVDRLEQTEGYTSDMPVAILGGVPSEKNYPSTEVTKEALRGYFGASGDYCADSTQKFATFMRHYQGVTIQTVSDEEEQRLANTQEYASMPCFPQEDSVALVDGVWVIKLQ